MSFPTQIPEKVASSEIYQFTLKIRDQDVHFDLCGDVEITYENIIEVLEHTPRQFIYWAGMYTECKGMAEKLENMINSRKARLTEEMIINFQQAGTKPTDTQIKMLINGDATLDKLLKVQVDLKRTVSKLYYMTEAIKMMSENARSLSGFAKAERSRA